MSETIGALAVKIFADGADKPVMLDLYSKAYIKGLTTNPTLMRQAGISNYEAFAREIPSEIKDKPLSLEVLSDDFTEMERQAMKIAECGDNVSVKIPITNTRRESSCPLVRRLTGAGVKVNFTALMTLAQVRDVVASLGTSVPSFVSVFAGRIADTGTDPAPLMAAAVGCSA